MHVPWLLNALITTLHKRPKMLFNRQVGKLLTTEIKVIEDLLSFLDAEQADVLRRQLGEINYVDRGVQFDRYEAIFSKVSGLVVDTNRSELLKNTSEHLLVEKNINWGSVQFHAGIYAACGYLVSLEASVDLRAISV